ncbi:MAG: hypothetical protein JST64_08420 [Actinobacteria bacterium]|nr:hypothetical protein [Actinomycetota bacterium]
MSAESEELADLRLRVAAQDRLIQAMLEENEQIHQLRQSTHAVARIYDRYHSSPVFAAGLRVWRRLRSIVPGIAPTGGESAER